MSYSYTTVTYRYPIGYVEGDAAFEMAMFQ